MPVQNLILWLTTLEGSNFIQPMILNMEFANIQSRTKRRL
jgi:hypothetical protein